MASGTMYTRPEVTQLTLFQADAKKMIRAIRIAAVHLEEEEHEPASNYQDHEMLEWCRSVLVEVSVCREESSHSFNIS